MRRRRECLECGESFATSEHVQDALVMVVKKDGRREEFQRVKLTRGLRVSLRKRPLPEGCVQAIADDIERRLLASGRGEVSSRVIGELAISHLKQLDPIAYIRFASAYRQFVSLDDMLDELTHLAENPLPPAEQPRLFDDDLDRLLALHELPRTPTPIAASRH